MLQLFLEYNHILPFLAAVGLFAFFYRIKITGRTAGLVCRIAPYTLGVYLLHENLELRYTWQKWMGAEKVAMTLQKGGFSGLGMLFWGTAAAVLCVFVCGVLTDVVRNGIFGMLHRGLLHLGPYRALLRAVERADGIFRADG